MENSGRRTKREPQPRQDWARRVLPYRYRFPLLLAALIGWNLYVRRYGMDWLAKFGIALIGVQVGAWILEAVEWKRRP
jgi:hypothetical protein